MLANMLDFWGNSDQNSLIGKLTPHLSTTPPLKKKCVADPFAEFRSKEVRKEDTQPIDDPEKMADEEVTKYTTITYSHATSGFNPLQ